MHAHHSSRALACLTAALAASPITAHASDPFADMYSPPSPYYASVTGTGAALKTSIYNAVRAGHIQRRYGDFRNSAVLHDADPNIPGRILLAYNRASISGQWDSGATWNREHVWPQSLQPGSASNSSTGNLGDPHALRPCNPGINSSRGNKPFGFATTTGAHRSLGGYYFTGDTDRGDIARSLMYSDTRYGPETGIELVNGFPSGNRMGDLESLVAWHYADPPDTFERRRNHVIATQLENPSFYTNNRNAYIDMPELVWSVYVDQLNDSAITLAGTTPDAMNGSMLVITDTLFADAPAPPSTVLVLSKAGMDGTYFSVLASGDAVSSIEGRFNAFPVLTTGGGDAMTLEVSLDAPTGVPGLYSGDVVIDNLDVTTQFGPGHGAQDADDAVMLDRLVVDRAAPSLDQTAVVTSAAVDLGVLIRGSGDTAGAALGVHNIEQTPSFTADLEITGTAITGTPGPISAAVTGAALIPAGGSSGLAVEANASSIPGTYNAVVRVESADDLAIPGAASKDDLTVTVTLVVEPCPGDTDTPGQPADAVVDLQDLLSVLSRFGQSGSPWTNADTDGDGETDLADLLTVLANFGTVCN